MIGSMNPQPYHPEAAIVQSRPVLVQMLGELEDLLTEDDPQSRPTPASVARMRQVLTLAGDALQEKLPYGYVMDDGEQGCRVEWENKPAQLYASLLIHSRPGESDYIYFQSPSDKGLNPISIANLCSALDLFAAKCWDGATRLDDEVRVGRAVTSNGRGASRHSACVYWLLLMCCLPLFYLLQASAELPCRYYLVVHTG